MLAMQRGGADIIELGIPFSDPIADGPVIQEANAVRISYLFHLMNDRPTWLQTALNNDINYEVILSQLREARGKGLVVPVILMGISFHLVLLDIPDEIYRLF